MYVEIFIVEFAYPNGVYVNQNSSIFMANCNNYAIRKVEGKDRVLFSKRILLFEMYTHDNS